MVELTDEIRDQIISALKNGDSYEEIMNYPEDKLILLHHSLGRWIRNTFELWKDFDPDMVDEDESNHPDTISMEWIKQIHKYCQNN